MRDEKVVRGGGKKTFSNGGLSRIKKHSLANDADVRRILISRSAARIWRGAGAKGRPMAQFRSRATFTINFLI